MPNSILFETEKQKVRNEASIHRRSEKFVKTEKKKNVKIYQEEDIKETDYIS